MNEERGKEETRERERERGGIYAGMTTFMTIGMVAKVNFIL